MRNKSVFYMALKAIILDLDQTLINYSVADTFMKNKQWDKVYSLVPSFKMYQGTGDLFKLIKNRNLKICIVSSFPSEYCQKVISYWKIPYDALVCQEDVTTAPKHKNPIHLALDKLAVGNDEAAFFGDSDIDIEMANKAGVYSVGCIWWSDNSGALLGARPDYLVSNPSEIVVFLTKAKDFEKLS